MGRHYASAGGRQSLARALRPRRRDHDPRRGRGDPVPPDFRKAARRACRLVRPDSNEHSGGTPTGFRGPRARDVSENGAAGVVSLYRPRSELVSIAIFVSIVVSPLAIEAKLYDQLIVILLKVTYDKLRYNRSNPCRETA